MLTSHSDARAMLADVLVPAWRGERSRLDRIDRWWRWDHDSPHQPRQATREYRDLAERSMTPWLGLVVTAVAQALYVEGYRSTDGAGNAEAWRWWQANRMDARQVAVHRSALAYGHSYVTVLPGRDPLTGVGMPKIRGYSPRNLVAVYVDPAEVGFPEFAVALDPAKHNGQPGWDVLLYDDQREWRFHASQSFDKYEYVEFRDHGVGVCPVVRYANQLDLEGRTPGEVEPNIPTAARIDQTTFDRLVVQRFSSWVVRTIAGMSPPERLEDETAEEYRERTKLRLSTEDILIADDPDTKFGSLPASPLSGFIEAHDTDVRVLAAVTQTPPHHLLGQMANLSAEALAAAESSLMRKVDERQHAFGEAHEQVFQLCDVVMGSQPDPEAQVRWRDTESRSLAQAVDALAKLHTIGVPVEMLLEKVPGWTQQDVDRAKTLIAEGGSLDALLRELTAGQVSPDGIDG